MDAQPGAGNAIRDQLANFLSLVTTQVDSLEAQNRALLAERDRLGRELATKQEEAIEAAQKAADAQAILDSAIAESEKRREQGNRYAQLIRAQAQQAAASLRELAERIEADAQQQAGELEDAIRGALGTPAPASTGTVSTPDVPETAPTFIDPAVDLEVPPSADAPSLEKATGVPETADEEAAVIDLETGEEVAPVADVETTYDTKVVAEVAPVADVNAQDGDVLSGEPDRVTGEIEAVSDEPQSLQEAVALDAEAADEAPATGITGAVGLNTGPSTMAEASEVVEETLVEASGVVTAPVPEESRVEEPVAADLAEPVAEAPWVPTEEGKPAVPPIIESDVAPRSPVIFPALGQRSEPRSETPVPLVPPTVPSWKPEVVSRNEPVAEAGETVEPVAPVEATEPVEQHEDHRSGWQGAVINAGRTAVDDEVTQEIPQESVVEEEASEPVTYDVVARPFTNFSSLVTFQKAIREIPGISDVRVRVFQNNSLSMALTYGGPTGVTEALSLVNGFDVTDISVDDNRIEMTVVSTASKASA